ncbi:hypothetical protein SAY86_005609 [Trapa natans]|uniref:Uncharacterized protein n=1 Tax=Trapa natans TaxID=22666 RepID=A0AAN7L110_TRANT|nr:hypothetical protein SAY86_005609 [Trapa natans]
MLSRDHSIYLPQRCLVSDGQRSAKYTTGREESLVDVVMDGGCGRSLQVLVGRRRLLLRPLLELGEESLVLAVECPGLPPRPGVLLDNVALNQAFKATQLLFPSYKNGSCRWNRSSSSASATSFNPHFLESPAFFISSSSSSSKSFFCCCFCCNMSLQVDRGRCQFLLASRPGLICHLTSVTLLYSWIIVRVRVIMLAMSNVISHGSVCLRMGLARLSLICRSFLWKKAQKKDLLELLTTLPFFLQCRWKVRCINTDPRSLDCCMKQSAMSIRHSRNPTVKGQR